MSDRNFTPPSRPRDIERYAELSDLLGDVDQGMQIMPHETALISKDHASLENALASVDASFPRRPRELPISNSSVARSWQATPGTFTRATPFAAPLAPQSLDAWNLQPSIEPQLQPANEAYLAAPDLALSPAAPALETEPELSDEEAFLSVLDGLEGDLFVENEFDSPSQNEVTRQQIEAEQLAQAYALQTPAAQPVASNEGVGNLAPALERNLEQGFANVNQFDAVDQISDFDAVFLDDAFQDSGAQADQSAANQQYVEAEFQDLSSNLQSEFDPFTPLTPTVIADGDLDHLAQRANSSREIQAEKHDLPDAEMNAGADVYSSSEPHFSAFPDTGSPYEDVPSTGSLNVPEFAVAEPVAAQRSPEFDDFEMSDFEPAPAIAQTVAQPQTSYSQIIVHEQPQKTNQSNEFDELADVNFDDVFDADFNPTDELASIVSSNDDDGFGNSNSQFSSAKHDDFVPMPALPPVEAPRASRTKWIVLGTISLALLGSIAFFGNFGGSSDTGDEPAIVRADNVPVRVAPENPGGTVVPNQDRVVFNEVGAANTVPEQQQEALINGRQEPMIAGAPLKEDDRVLNGDNSIEPLTGNGAAIMPRAVQTVTVRPDGTLVVNQPAELQAPTPQAEVLPETRPDPAAQPLPQAPEATIAAEPEVALTPQVPAETKVPVRVVELKPVLQKPKTAEPKLPSLDAVPSRPADQPVNIVNSETPTAIVEQPAEQLAAAVEAVETVLAAGSYVMQIASTPTEAAANSTLRSLSGKYASVLGGKDYAIQKADVPGKGTFYRIRILAGSKEDATKLCARYKSAGGSCFVTR